MKNLGWFKLLAYLVGGFMVLASVLMLIADPADAPLVLMITAMVLGMLGTGLSALRRREALRQSAQQELESAFQPSPEALTRRALARHPALGPGELELTLDALRFTGGPPRKLGEIAYAGLDLHKVGLWQAARRVFRVWCGRKRLRESATEPRTFELPREQIFACAAFDGVTHGPELVVGWRPDDSGAARWELVFLAEVIPGSFATPTDDPALWVRALQPPQTAEDGQRQARRARHRIHRRLAFAETVFASSVAGIVLGSLVLLMLAIAVFTGDSAAAGVAVALVMIWAFTALLIGTAIWWSHR